MAIVDIIGITVLVLVFAVGTLVIIFGGGRSTDRRSRGSSDSGGDCGAGFLDYGGDFGGSDGGDCGGGGCD